MQVVFRGRMLRLMRTLLILAIALMQDQQLAARVFVPGRCAFETFHYDAKDLSACEYDCLKKHAVKTFSGASIAASNSGSSSFLSPERFTGKERDGETGLDYFGARYMSAAMGRFTSPDPLLSSGRPDNPQSWNRFSCVLNNPLRYTDPLGLYVWDRSLGGDTTDDEVRKSFAKKQANQIIGRRNDIRNALAAGAKIKDSLVQVAIAAYGAERNANGVSVAMGKLDGDTAAQVGPGNPPLIASADGQSITANMIVTFDFSKVSGVNDLVVNAAHEGQHMVDRQKFAAGANDPNAFDGPRNLTTYQTEVNAYTTGAAPFGALNPNSGYVVGGQLLWNPGWATVDRQALDKLLAVPKPKGSYGVTPQNPGPVLYPK